MNRTLEEIRADYAVCKCENTGACKHCKIKNRPVLDYDQIEDIQVDGIDFSDANDFCDAFICSATYMGRDMTDEELDVLNDDGSFVYDCVISKIY